MSVLKNLNKLAVFALLLPLAVSAQPDGEERPFRNVEWRTFTAPDGSRIVGYLKDVRPDEVVIVRRDGREFITPWENFSESNQAYISEWAQQNLPTADYFRSIDFNQREFHESYEIEELEHRRPAGGEPLEPAAVKMILDFHGIEYSEDLADRIAVREIYQDTLIPPQDLVSALESIPVTFEIIGSSNPYGPEHDERWESVLNVLRTAISFDLPVLVGYRPDFPLAGPDRVGVANGYDRQDIYVVEPAGSQQPVPFDLEAFGFMFTYAMIIFPTYEPPIPPIEELQINAEFLNFISATIRELPLFDPLLLHDILRERGVDATIQDVNRSDYRDMLGSTRQFAREGGIPLIDAALDNGRVVVVPQEYEDGEGFALIYGRADDAFATVEFFSDRMFRRGLVSRSDLANRWITREDRTYFLDLIQIVVPPASRSQ